MKKKSYRHVLSQGVVIKLLTIMKITFTLLLICTFSVSASVISHAQKLTLNMENATIRQVFDEIEKQTGFKFFYVDEQVDVSRKVNLALTDKTVEDILNELFDKKQIKYRIFENKLAVLSSADIIQQIKITGKVVDAKTGEALPGVSVQVEGSTIGGISDVNGKYAIELPDLKATLIFSYLGYLQERVAVEGRTTIDVSLSQDIKTLDEVVVVGYGTQKKRTVTNALTSFKTDKLDERPLARVDQALVGQMAGVQVKQTNGTPGRAFSVSVRGSGSISAGNEPLYVIDGFPLATAQMNAAGSFSTGNPLDNINTNDIESIQVLKDASAAAIYGSRAANGVVLITTKSGKMGKPKISFNAYSGYSEAVRKIDMLSSQEWIDRAIEMINAQWVASGTGRTADQTTAQRAAILGLAPGVYNTNYQIDDRWLDPQHKGLSFIDWQDQVLRKGKVQNYQLSATGGNETVKYYMSANYGKQEGIVKGMDFTSYSARVNVEAAANKNLKFGINLTPTYSIANDPGVEGKDNIWHQAISLSPVQEDTMGLNVNVGDFWQYKWSNSRNSPTFQLENSIGETKRFRTITSVFGEYQIIKGLTFKTTLNLDYTDNTTRGYYPYTTTGTLASRQANNNTLTSGTLREYKRQTFVNENTLTYNRTINKHDISLLAGASYNSDYLSTTSLNSSGGFNTSGVETLNEASSIVGGTEQNANTDRKNVLLSYFGRIQYSFSDKYLFSASLRTDGSSRFGANTKWATFPSASVAWRVSGEDFMKSIKTISDLKLRFSWGTAGNYNIGDYSSIAQLSTYSYAFGTTKAVGRAVNASVNPDLTWETSSTIDVGMEIGVLDNRLTGSFDYYNKLNTGLLLYVPIPQASGFGTQLSNTGKVRNKGWEIELTSHNLVGKFSWTTTFNLSHNENKVEALGPGQTQILVPSSFDISHSILKVGEQINSIYVVRQTGILTQADIDNNIAQFGKESAGDPKYFDANGDGKIDADDRVIVGHPNPDYVWGCTNTITYKGFDLSILVQGQQGGKIYSLLGRAISRTGQGYVDNITGNYRNRWRSADNPGDGKTPKAYSTFGRIVNTDWLYSSDYWRIRNITLGYDLGRLFKVKQIQGARIYVTVENWFGQDKYKGGANPEALNTDVSGSTTYPEASDYGGLPLSKQIIVGLNLNF